MALTLSDTLSSIFAGNRGSTYGTVFNEDNNIELMSILIDGDFEVPTFMLDKIKHKSKGLRVVSIINLICISAWYKSLDATMKRALSCASNGSLFVRVPVKQGSKTIYYYVANGIIMDSDMNILAVCAQQLHYCEDDKIEVKRNIIRVNKHCFVDKGNAMERFVSGKLITTFLSENINIIPFSFRRSNDFKSEVIITEDFPYNITVPSVPDAKTTNKELLQVVLDHIDNTDFV